MRDVALGIDIGGTFTKYGFVDHSGECIKDGSISTTENPEIHEFQGRLADTINDELKDLGNDANLVGIGIGAPNGNYYTGTIDYAPNLNWKGVVHFVELFKKHFNLPMALTNDANAAALGEMIYGGAKDLKNFVEITLGTGLGSGIVVNGEVVYGHDGFAGECGHVMVYENGRMCGCGQRGCLETYASATGIRRTVFELMASEIIETKMRTIAFDDLTAKMIAHFAQDGDEIALQAFEFTGKILGMKLADTVAHTSPEAIFLFGGLANAGDLIFKPTKEHFEKNLLPIYREKIKILPSELKETNAAVLGASALAWKEMGE
ncbi:ROK family protein [Bacteroidota bacterium]